MPLFIGLIFEIVAGFAAFLVSYFTQKVAVTLACVAVLAALLIGLYGALKVALAAITSTASGLSPMFGAGVSMVISTRTSALIASYLIFWAAVELYKWKFNILQLWARTI